MTLTPAPAILNPRIVATLQRRFNCDFLIQSPLDVADGSGGRTRTWPTFVETLGAIYYLTGAEKLAQGSVAADTLAQVIIPYVAGIDATMRVQYGTRIFDIGDVIDYGEQHLLLELLVTERFRK